jgi:hypothetical protein
MEMDEEGVEVEVRRMVESQEAEITASGSEGLEQGGRGEGEGRRTEVRVVLYALDGFVMLRYQCRQIRIEVGSVAQRGNELNTWETREWIGLTT